MEVAAIIVIAVAWWLNAVADAIDHGKGARRLLTLWHLVKDASYILPFGYIVYLTKLPWYGVLTALFMCCGWYFIYGYLRFIRFHEKDDIWESKLHWLSWLWTWSD